MNRLFCSGVAFVVLLLSGVEDCSGGTTGFHRETSLDELKGIDSLVSTGLPLFSHGFFIATGNKMKRDLIFCIKILLALTLSFQLLFT